MKVALVSEVAALRVKSSAVSVWMWPPPAGLECANHGLWTRGLLIRRNITDGEFAYFTTWCPAGTSIETLVNVEGHRWSIEDSFETAKNEFGLDHNETRSWHGWHRHVSLVMMAFAMMAAIRLQANQSTPKKTSQPSQGKSRARSSVGRSRKSVE